MAKIALFTVYDSFGLGIRLIAKYLEEKGHEVHLGFLKIETIKDIDLPKKSPTNYEHLTNWKIQGCLYDVAPWTCKEVELLVDRIASVKPDIVGFSSRSFLDNMNTDLINSVRKGSPDAVYVAGGYGPSFSPEKYIGACDYVVVGEGEEAMLEIADAVDAGTSLDSIANLAYLANGELIRNKPRPMETDLSKYSIPRIGTSRTFFINNDKLDNSDMINNSYGTYRILAGRGCTGTCTYCSTSEWESLYSGLGKNPKVRRYRDLDSVIEELVFAKEQGFRQINFIDSFLIAPRKDMLNIFKRYHEEVGLPFYASLHPKQILTHPEILDAAIKAGLTNTCVAIQSGCESFAKVVYHRQFSNEEILRFTRTFHDQGLPVVYHFLTGNPLESEEDLDESLDFVSQLPFDLQYDNLYAFRLFTFPGTLLTKMIEQKGLNLPEPEEFLYQSLLYPLRIYTDDETFNSIRRDPLYRKYPQLLKEICGEFYYKKVMAEDRPMFIGEHMFDVYKRFLRAYPYKPILVWGLGNEVLTYWRALEGVPIEAVIHDNPDLWGSKINGIEVRGPNFLNETEPKPILICSGNKAEVYKRIQKDYPKYTEIP